MGVETALEAAINSRLSTTMNQPQLASEFMMARPLSEFGRPRPNSSVRGQSRAISQAAAAVVGCQATLAAVSLRAAGTQALLGDVAQLLGLPEVQAGSFSSKSAATPGKIVATPAAPFWQQQVR